MERELTDRANLIQREEIGQESLSSPPVRFGFEPPPTNVVSVDVADITDQIRRVKSGE